jgi:MFS family permease
MRGLRFVLSASAAALFLGAIFNVCELLLARNELDAGQVGFSVLVTLYGVGFICGTLSGAKGGGPELLRRRYLMGLFLMGAGVVGSGIAPVLATAVVTFVAAGYGNGLLLVYERLLIQAVVPDSLSGRVFGVKDALTAWAFAFGFLAGPVVLALVGTRGTVVGAGAGALIVWSVSLAGLRGAWWEDAGAPPEGEPLLSRGGVHAVGDAGAREQSPHLVGS